VGTHTKGLKVSVTRSVDRLALLWKTSLVLVLALVALPLSARKKEAVQYGMGVIVNIPLPESEVTQVVQDVVQNGIIRGSKEYNKDEYITGATVAISSRVFKEWTEGGKVFYKVRLKALDPQNFKDTNDTGTLAVRYVVQGQGDSHTILRIDAVFVEDFRHVSHASNGSVEGAEYKNIHDHLDALELMKTETADAEKEKQARSLAATQSSGTPRSETSSSSSSSSLSSPSASVSAAPAVAPPPVAGPVITEETPANEPSQSIPQSSSQTLEQRVKDLKQQVMRLVKSPGAPLKSAPFHTATTLQSLPTATEVLIVVSTTYWLGVETHQGQHGWILRDELELLP